MSSSTPAGPSRNAEFAVPARKSNMAAPTTIPSKESKSTASKQHKRSRSGCFTCRLRRKKCDEAKPACKACKHLGLQCAYKRPQWWGNSEQRREQKDYIKDVIKHTQLQKKSQSMSHSQSIGSATPPGLCHSISTPEGFSDSFIGSYNHSRAASMDQSPLTSDPNFPTLSPESYFGLPPHPHLAPPPQYALFHPGDLDSKTERQIFVNDFQTRRDSTISSFSFFQPPALHSVDQSPAAVESWPHQDYFDPSKEPTSEDPITFDFFDLPNDHITPTLESVVDVDEQDRPLLNHFVDQTSRLFFPVLDATQHGTARSGIILPALETNLSFRHCCLSTAGSHRKAIEGPDSPETPEIQQAIMRHKCATITELCNELGQDQNHEQILETTLSLIFFPSCVGSPEDAYLPDIPWHHHLASAKNLIEIMGLPERLREDHRLGINRQIPFSMTLFAWIDILGATMRGKSPILADVYRELNIAKRTIGLQELMGCDDTLMYLISEIACLEERKLEGMDDVVLCRYIEILGTAISQNEPASACDSAVSPEGILRPKSLTQNMTAVFRFAARIYLCSMVPGFDNGAPSTIGLVQNFVEVINYVPPGATGFDRSLAWPLLVAGSVSTPDSSFRVMFTERYGMIGNEEDVGSIGRVKDILSDLWTTKDTFTPETIGTPLHWRDVVAQKQWDCLLI